MTEDKNKHLFFSLIYSFQMQTMMQLGKIANPMSGTIERDLDAAQMTIDMIDMLKAKTKGNTTDEESRFLDQAIADLKLNYVEEKNKGDNDTKPGDTKQPEIEETTPASEEPVPPAAEEKPLAEEKAFEKEENKTAPEDNKKEEKDNK